MPSSFGQPDQIWRMKVAQHPGLGVGVVGAGRDLVDEWRPNAGKRLPLRITDRLPIGMGPIPITEQLKFRAHDAAIVGRHGVG